MVAGLLFLQHGLEKLFGFAGARPEPTLWGIRGLAYMLIAQPRTLWPIRNGGIEALLYCVVLLYFAAAGAGAWSLDARRTRAASAVASTRPQVA